MSTGNIGRAIAYASIWAAVAAIIITALILGRSWVWVFLLIIPCTTEITWKDD